VTRLLAGEMIKVRTTRTALGFGIAAVLLTLANVLVTILAGDPVQLTDKRGALNFGGAISIVLLLFGAVGATGEFRHRTLAPAVLIAPDRFRLVLARIAAYSFTGLLFGLAMAVVTVAIGVALLPGQEGPDVTFTDYAEIVGGGLIAVVLSAAIGVGVGTLVRNQVAAVVGILVWLTILEPLLAALIEELNLVNGMGQYTLGETLGRVGMGGNDDMGLAASALVLVGWAVVLCAAGALIDRARDVD
jgi:ABC-2 type transport system permease protein